MEYLAAPEVSNHWTAGGKLVLESIGDAVSISERRVAERERDRLQREVVRQYTETKAIYETSSVALAMIDPIEFRYVRRNPKLAEILHLPIEEILGTPVFDLAGEELVRAIPKDPCILTDSSAHVPVSMVMRILEPSTTGLPAYLRPNRPVSEAKRCGMLSRCGPDAYCCGL